MRDYIRGDKKRRGNHRTKKVSGGVVKSSSKSKSKHTSNSNNLNNSNGFFHQLLKIIGAGLAGLLILTILFRSISWSQIFSLDETQTILFATKSVEQQGMLLARFYADETKVEVITLDPNSEIEVVGGYGTYRAQAMYPLLALEGKSDQFIRASLGLTLGMILDRTVVVKEGNIDVGGQSAGQQSAIAFKNLLWRAIKDPSTSLSLWERIQLASLLLDTRTSIDIYDQSSSDFQKLDQEFSASYQMGETGPGCSVALINTTQTAGLARKLDGLLAGDKLYVVRTINEDDILEKTEVFMAKEQRGNRHCQQALSKLSKVVPDGFEKKMVLEKELQQYRADVVVKIGQDLAR